MNTNIKTANVDVPVRIAEYIELRSYKQAYHALRKYFSDVADNYDVSDVTVDNIFESVADIEQVRNGKVAMTKEGLGI